MEVSKIMRGVIAILAGLGVGAGLMYLLDPDRGNRRRALIRDKAVKLNRQTREAVGGKVTDIGNRAKGMLHEARSAFDKESKEESMPQPTTFG